MNHTRSALFVFIALMPGACVQQQPMQPIFPQGFGGPSTQPPPPTTPLSPQSYTYPQPGAPTPAAQPQARASQPPAPRYPAAASSPPAAPLPPAPRYPAAAAPPPPAPVASGWRLAAQPQEEPLAAGGATHRVLRVTDGRSTVDLDLVTFDTRKCALRVIDQPDANAGGRVIAPLMRAHRAVAGVNGGFFTPAFAPLGDMIAGGRHTGAISKSKLLSGMVLSAGGQSWLMWRDEFRGDTGATDLIQAGPRLVSEHAPVGGLDRAASRTRTFIITDGANGWSVGLARGVSLGGLADILATPGIIPSQRVWRALNLDGGNSSAIWMQTRSREISEPGWSTVRNYLAIVPRS